jgi:hypothetical protein
VAEYIDPVSLPGVFQRYAKNLGDRIKKPGNERLVMTGELTASGKRDQIVATVELPGKVRVQYAATNRVVAFDKTDVSAPKIAQDSDQALVDTLAYDSAEAFLFATLQGTLPRILGFGFVTPGDKGAFGAAVDIFETTQVIRSGTRDAVLAKQFQFDTQTGLLRRVTYRYLKGTTPVKVETELSQYQSVAGSKAPQKITRKEGGVVVMDIALTGLQAQPKQNDNTFKP